jgi:hypothetical protein
MRSAQIDHSFSSQSTIHQAQSGERLQWHLSVDLNWRALHITDYSFESACACAFRLAAPCAACVTVACTCP